MEQSQDQPEAAPLGTPLAGKVALVTGSGSGIGRATAVLLARRGAAVVTTDLAERIAAAEETAALIAAAGGRTLAVALDVRQPATIRAAVVRAVEAFGALDIMVCNAGINIRKPALEFTEEDWDAVVAVNLRGVFFSAQAAAAHMVRQGRGGKIVSIASIYGLVGGPDRAAYCASKGGVVNLTRALALEWAPHRIQVNAVAPTFVLTPLTASLFQDPAFLQSLLARQPDPRLAPPEAVAEAVAFLASPQADLITGVTLPVDGGWTAI